MSDWIKFLDKITVIPHMSFRNHFLYQYYLTLLSVNILKTVTFLQKACRLVRLRTLTFTPKKSNEIFLKIFFLPTGIFLIKILSLSPVVCLW